MIENDDLITWRQDLLLDGLVLDFLLAQVAADRSPVAGFLDRFGLAMAIVLIGIAIAVAWVWLLRTHQTPAKEMPRSERWLLIGLVGIVAGVTLAMVLRAVI